MANRTAKDAKSIKGTNPQYLVEKIIRTRIYDSKYWKEECFGLTAELLVDKAMDLDHVGGVFGANIKPTPFLCLILKMLQIQPSKDIIIEFIKNPDLKYVRCLGAVYLRLVGETLEVYNYLEPLYNDYRKIKRKNRNGDLELLHVDELIDELLREDRVCDIILPRIQKRSILEQNEQLEPRVSALDEDLSDLESEEDDEPESDHERDRHSRRSPSPSHRHHDRDRERARDRDRERDRDRDRERRRSRSRSPGHRRHSRSRSRDRDRHRRRSRSRSRSPRRHDSHRHSHHKRSRSRSRSPPSKHSSGKDKEREKSKRSEKSSSSRSDKDKSKSSSSSKSSKEKKKGSSGNGDDKKLTAEEEEIRQANELRAKLGLKPLRV